MGYTGSYSLGSRCISEAVGLMLVIYLGESVVANAELPRTKAHGMSFGWVSAGFGAAFGLALAMFSCVSAHLNPAACLALWLIGDLSAGDFFALSAAELLGAFLGAVLVWMHFLPHFKTIPTPPLDHPAAGLLALGDSLAPNARQLASYNAHPSQRTHDEGLQGALMGSLEDLRYYTSTNLPLRRRKAVAAAALGRDSVINKENYLRRRTVQVSDMHNRLQDLDLHDLRDDIRSHARSGMASAQADVESEAGRRPAMQQQPAGGDGGSLKAADAEQKPPLPPTRMDQLLEAAAAADRATKLSVFATRPAVRAPLLNFLVEFLGTTTLIATSRLLSLQAELLTPELQNLWRPFEAAFVGLLVFALVLGLGGPTGIAMNPARDLGPRIAHALLPIPGKGGSEWEYGWIPVMAGLLGGLAGGGLFAAIRHLFHTPLDL